MKEVYIVAAQRTAIGGFLGSLSNFSATELGAHAIKAAIAQANISPENINSVYFGNVLSANIGQSPARQAAVYAGIPNTVDSTTINKVCASGLKAMLISAQQIQLGLEHMNLSGGMESMSNTPHYLQRRSPIKLGNEQLVDGLLKDGLTDAYNGQHMGNAAELCASTYKIAREQQDEYALRSYERAANATSSGKFKNEIIPISLKSKTGEVLFETDEDVAKIIPAKVPQLKPSFQSDGTITAANASNLNDGAAAIILASKEEVQKQQLKPLARIVAYADAALAPEWFTMAPTEAIKKLLKATGLSINDIDYFEINEAYAAVALANQKTLGIASEKLNVYGGAVAMGHPLGASGARIVCTLTSVLLQEGGRYGIAAICNGGGAATAVLLETIHQ